MSNVLTCDGCGQPIQNTEASIMVNVQTRTPQAEGSPGIPGMPGMPGMPGASVTSARQLDYHLEHAPEGLVEAPETP